MLLKVSKYFVNKMDYGLTLKQLLTLAYKYAESSGCKYPKSWKENKRAGKDWAAGFRKRNPELSLRKKRDSNKTAEEMSTVNKLVFNDDLALTDTCNMADMTGEAEKPDAHFVDTEARQKNEPVDLEVIKSSTLEVDLEPVSDTDDPLNFFSLKGILSPELVRPHPKKSVTKNVLKRKRREKGRSRKYTETPEKNSLKSFRKELQKLKQQVKELKVTKKLLELTEVKKANTMTLTSLPPEIDADSSHDIVINPSDSEDIEMPAESEDEEQTNDNISQTESLLQTKIEVDSDVDQRYENEPEASTSNPWWSASASRTSPDDVPPKLANEHAKRFTDNKNRFKVFGQYVGIRLQELPQQQRILAEKVINEALYLAEMGNLTTSHSVRN